MATGRESAGKWPVRQLGPALCLLALAGCENLMSRPGFDGDPITGGGVAIPRAPAGSPASATAVAQPNPPPFSAPSSTTSPAALTGGANPTLDSAHDMRIGAGLGNQPPAPLAGNPPANTMTAGAVLRRPEPITDGSFQQAAVVQPPSGPVAAVPTSGAPTDTYQQLQDALSSRGVTWRRLETIADSGEWKFSCSIPTAQNPNLRHNYEARASTDLGTLRAVLDQIDRDRHP